MTLGCLEYGISLLVFNSISHSMMTMYYSLYKRVSQLFMFMNEISTNAMFEFGKDDRDS